MTLVCWMAVLVCVVQCSPMSQDELKDFSNFLLKTSSLDLHVKSADPDSSFDEDEVVSDHAWEESGKFEGDLILNDRQRRLIVENVEGLARNGLTDSTKRWPNNEVIYFIQKEHFTSGQVQAIQDGIDDLARASCVKFRPYRKGDRDAVVIQGSRRGCFSQVGYQGGYQVLNLSGRHPVGRGCFRHGTVVHELLHSLGFYHMQSSPDRDDYINVIWSNILQPARHNFRKYNSFSVSDFGVGYDYDSVLHYSRRAFSANGQDTLVPKKSGAEIGQRVGLSDKDTQKLNKMYCDADSDDIQADENTTKKNKNKKKKPKNEPFEGHGIGYHQGKTVVIKLPAAQTYKLPNVPSTHVFDFSKTPKVVPPEAEGYRFGKELIYSYKPIFSLNTEKIKDHQHSYEDESISHKNTQKLHQGIDDNVEPSKEDKDKSSSTEYSKEPNEVKPEYVPSDEYDKDLKDAFHRLTELVKQHVYPQNSQNSGYDHKINKDYSKFFSPPQSKPSNSFQDSLGAKYEQPVSEDQTPMLLKIIDSKRNKIQDTNSDDKFKNSQLEDRMDTSYRVSLPTKKPYSSYEQTETPLYATLDYLKKRHDYSNLYASENYDYKKHDNDSTFNVKKSEHDIKISPYGQILYTDYADKDSKERNEDFPRIENFNKELKSSKSELDKSALNKQSVSVHKQLKDRIDSTDKIFFPTKKSYSEYEQTETPKYATLEYLKDRHVISNLYTPRTSEIEKRKELSTMLEGDLPPTESDWYKKDLYKHHPANYDRDSYSDYVQLHHKEPDGEIKDHNITNVSKYNNDENSEELYKNKEKNEPGNDDQDFDTDYEKENSENLGKSIEEIFDHGYDTGNNYYHHITNDTYGKDAPKNSKLKIKPIKYNENYYTDYEKDHSGRSIEESSENIKESPQKNLAYTLYGTTVPVVRDWFKPSYAIPGITNKDKISRPHEDRNR